MGNTPIHNFQILFPLFYFFEQGLGIEIFQRNLVHKLTVELSQFYCAWQQLRYEVFHGFVDFFLLQILLREINREGLLGVTVDKKMVAATVEVLQPVLGSDAAEDAFVDNTYTIAEDICLLHGVCREHHRAVLVLLAVLKNVPELTPSVWIQTSRGLVQEDDLWLGDQADGY